jgi:hypothetical protein
MPLPGIEGDVDDMALYAGQSTHLVHGVLPAARIVRAIVADAADIVTRLAPVRPAGRRRP